MTPPVSTSTPKTTRDAILDAAGVLLGRLGYHRTTMDGLAQEANVARRTLYLHFQSKDEIFLERIDRVVQRLLVDLRAIADTNTPAPERLRAMLVARVMHRFESVRGYYLSLDEIFQSLRKLYLDRRETYFAAEAREFARVLEQGRAAGDFEFDDVETTARALIVATNGLLPYSLSPKELGSRKDVESESGSVAALLVQGLKTQRAPAKKGKGK